MKHFEVSDEMLARLRKMADDQKIPYDHQQAERSKPLFKMVIKGLIGRDIYDNPTYFKVFNQYDPIFRQALELINSADYDKLLSPLAK